ncbi:hypothetical protein [Thauera sp. Sel9]|uniref:hypothetical protein n=1 Tax=Thauera sp. Sel9 TaxID=2974299 RepID=UPI0021E13CC8|nr:hypothetical protein [Thauera sp. Sel9]MCV2219889.1 hypothetical protein [Thauera sp. Sel9]
MVPPQKELLATHDSARALVLASLELEIGLDEVFEGVDAAASVTASAGSPS